MRAVGDGPQTLRVRPMFTYAPKVVGAPTGSGAQGGGKAPQRGVRRLPRSPLDRDRPRRSRERRIQTGRHVRQRLGARAGCVSWKAVDVTANSSARPCPSPRLAPRRRASSRFLSVAPPVRHSIAHSRLRRSTTSRRLPDVDRGQRIEASGTQRGGSNM